VHVLVLLPPSEGKAAPPRRGKPLDLEALTLPELTPTRASLLASLERLAQGPRPAAVKALGLSPGLAGEVDKDAVVSTAPTLPAARLYTGVLYEALDLTSLPPAALSKARRQLLVFSALFGVVRMNDRLPPYRLSPNARLPRTGTLAAVWKPALTEHLPTLAARGPIVDLRSGPYAAMWRPTGSLADRTMTVRVLHEAVPGDPSTRSIVSHFNKATKGRLVRDLMLDEVAPRSVDEVIDLWRQRGWTVEADSASAGARSVDVIVAQV
jgi:cytoplasmic iron level regulating protein YaaA (DUF328/UPF0246 family)